MLASIGAFTGQYNLVIPGYTANADPVTNLNEFVVNNQLGFTQIILAIAIIEGAKYPGNAVWRIIKKENRYCIFTNNYSSMKLNAM